MTAHPSTWPATCDTVCHRCGGDGTVHHPRAALDVEGLPVRGYDTRACPQCVGTEWLPGIVAPA